MIETVTVEYGRRTFQVQLSFDDRSRLKLTVHPDQSITAIAPLGVERDRVLRHLHRRGAWIAKQMDYFEDYQPLPVPRRYISGETHYYLGRQYRLRIRPGSHTRVLLKGKYFQMELPDTADTDTAKRLMETWYREHAKALLQRKVEAFLPRFLRLGATVPEVRFRRMQKRWGSCSGNGVVMLNTELVKAPLQSVEYVVVHELCHLIHPEHTPAFWQLLAINLPDWQQRKTKLEHTQL